MLWLCEETLNSINFYIPHSLIMLPQALFTSLCINVLCKHYCA